MRQLRSNLRKERNYLFLAIIVVVFLTLFGCGGGGGSGGGDNDGNQAPTANAGPDQTVDEGDPVSLDGSGSSDSDGTIASYSWTQLSGTVVILNGANTDSPSFTALGVAPSEDLVFQLTVTDDDGATDTDDVTVTVNVNAPPTASAGPDQTVDEGDNVTLDGTGSSDSDGIIASYSWTQQPGGTVVTLTDPDTATPSFTAPAVAASEDLVFQLTVTDDDGATDTDDVTVTVSDIVLLSVSQGILPAEIDLTTEGSSDWAHWARLATADINRKSTGGNQIGDYTEVGANNGENRMGSDLNYSFTWSDGNPTVAEPGVKRGLFFPFNATDGSQEGNGYSLTLTADTTPRTLKLYLGAFDATAKLVATLDDGSATSPDQIIANPIGSSWLNRVVTIVFRAEALTTMTVEFTLENDHSTASALSLVAATLAPGTVQPPVLNPNGGEFTDTVQVQMATVPSDAAIHYTLDNSDPLTSSTLYTGPFTIPVVGATTTVTVKARAFRANYSDSDIVTAVFTLNENNGGSLSAFVEDPPVDGVSLTSTGSSDWAHWGRTLATDINRKGTGGNKIGDYTEVGANDGINQIVRDLPYSFDWVDGNPTAFDVDVRKGIFFVFNETDGSQEGNGYSLTLAADATPRTLKLYLGAFNSTAKLVASLDDASASDAEVFVVNPDSGLGLYKVVTINFTAAGAANMTVTFTLEEDNGTPSALFLNAAALP